ncbi:hypothetical protein Tco_0817808 [Tanacetum coccineum]
MILKCVLNCVKCGFGFWDNLCAYDCYVNIMWVCPIVNAPAGRLLGAYDLGVATPRAVVHAGDKTSGDARSWYMISGDAKSWVCFDKVVLHDALRALVDMLLVAMLIEDVSLVVMSTLAYVDSKTITRADKAQSS